MNRSQLHCVFLKKYHAKNKQTKEVMFVVLQTSLASSSSAPSMGSRGAPIPAHIQNSLAGGSTGYRGAASDGATSGYSSRESTASSKQR